MIKKILLGLCLTLCFNVNATTKSISKKDEEINKVFSFEEAESKVLDNNNDSLIIDLSKIKEIIRIKSFSKRVTVAKLGQNRFLIKKRPNQEGFSSVFFEIQDGYKSKQEQITIEVK